MFSGDKSPWLEGEDGMSGFGLVTGDYLGDFVFSMRHAGLH